MSRFVAVLQIERRYALRLGLGLALVAVAVGALLGFAGPLITVGALLALAAALWALTTLEVGLWGTIAIIALLPFGTLPVKIVFTPTFLELVMLGVLLVYVAQWMSGRRRQLALTPAHAPLAVFMALAIFSFVAGMPNGPVTSNLLHKFAAFLLNLVFVIVVVDYLDSREKLGRLVQVLLMCGTLAALLGLAFYFLPETVSERALSALRVFGYPSGGVLRYIESDPTQPQRAIGTSVDPNMLGGLLAIMGGLLAPQLLTAKPILRWRWLTYLAFGIVLVCLVLTFSRTALAALVVALAGMTLARYRKLLFVLGLAGLVAGLAVYFLPIAQSYAAHFVEGLQGQDLATQMRFGEYKDALILISRYPFIGVGFAGAPEIDVYLGVSSAYLIMLEEMGVVGLAAFLLLMGVVFGWSYRHRQAVYAEAALTPLWLGAHAGLAAALGVGVLDHYFFNLEFQPAGALFWMCVALCLAATRLAVVAPDRLTQ